MSSDRNRTATSAATQPLAASPSAIPYGIPSRIVVRRREILTVDQRAMRLSIALSWLRLSRPPVPIDNLPYPALFIRINDMYNSDIIR